MVGNTKANRNHVELISSLPLEACRCRLAAEIDKPWNLRGNRPVIGWIFGARLRARKRINGRNSFQTMISAKLVGHAHSTHIRCRFPMHPFVIAFMALWLGGVLLTGGGDSVTSIIGAALSDRPLPEAAWAGLAGRVAMSLFCLGIICSGRRPAWDEREFLLNFICDTLNARPVGSAKEIDGPFWED